MKILKSVVHGAGHWYVRKICSLEFSQQTVAAHNERPIEYRFALQALAEKVPQSVLDIGSGTTAWPHLLNNCGYVVTAIDNVRDYWPRGMVNRHWTVLDLDIVDPKDKLSGTFDAITCISVIEHIEDHLRAINNIVSRLATGGILILTTPYSHHHPYPNTYKHPRALYGKGVPYICRSSSKAELDQWLAAGLVLERRELWQLFTGPIWGTGQRHAWQLAATENEPHQLGCFVLRKK